jgi:hypothetical protein
VTFIGKSEVNPSGTPVSIATEETTAEPSEDKAELAGAVRSFGRR